MQYIAPQKKSGLIHKFKVGGHRCTMTHEPSNGSGVQCVWEPPMRNGEWISRLSLQLFNSEKEGFLEQVAADA